MSPIEFQIRHSNSLAQPYYWRIVSTGNSAVLASSETYVHKQDAINAAYLVQRNAAQAEVLDYTKQAAAR